MKKSEFEELKRQQVFKPSTSKTKSFLKKAVAISLASFLTGVFVGCRPSNEVTPNVNPNPGIETPIEPENPTPENPTPENPTPEVPAQIPTATINAFVESLQNDNYSFKKKIDDNMVSHFIDGKDLYIKVSNNEKYFYTYKDSQMYFFEFDQTESSWIKTKTSEITSFDSLIYDTLASTEWNNFDEDTNTVTGTCGTLEYSLNLSSGELSGDIVGEIYNINKTNVILPTSYIDRTGDIVIDPSESTEPSDPSEPTDPSNPSDESENIYEIVGGKYVFDVVALKDVLLNWMQGDNQFGKDVLAEKSYTEASTDDIIYVQATSEKIEFGYTYHNSDKKYFLASYLDDDDLYAKLQSGDIQTKEEFVTFLNGMKIAKFKSSKEREEIDTTITDADFETLTQNTFTKLEEKGTQGSSINNDFPETKLENFSNAEVLYGFKTKNSDTTAGLDLGWMQQWHQYYIVKYDDNIEFVDFRLAGSTSNGENDAVKNALRNTKYWMIGNLEREDIDDNNAKLYDNASAKAMNYDILLNKKEREFV